VLKGGVGKKRVEEPIWRRTFECALKALVLQVKGGGTEQEEEKISARRASAVVVHYAIEKKDMAPRKNVGRGGQWDGQKGR